LSAGLSAKANHRSSGDNPFSNSYGGAIILTLAIVSLHFTGMTAMSVAPFPEAALSSEMESTFALAVSVGGISLLIAGMGVSSYLIDQSVQTEANEKLRHLALHDKLTGLPNRAHFTDRLEAEIDTASESGHRLAFLAIDLDGFKEINDGYGHAAGDAALVAISHRLLGRLRPGESLARLGGDEFGMLKPFKTDQDLTDFIKRVSDAFDQKVSVECGIVTLGGSIGVAVYPTDAHDAEQLASYADMAMYQAKSRLHARVVRFDTSLDETLSRKRRLTADLRDAIDNGDIRLVYQIQKNIRDRSVIGFEALARWDHPEFGQIPPGEFIALAEETGLIVPLGHWVLLKACTDAALWPEDLKVSVNVSPVQLEYENMALVVEDTLWKTGLPAERLALEITETAVIDNAEETVKTLREIQSFGATIAMDDFGTGYSSLASLRAFPFDLVKLDRSFISEVEESRQARDIVEAVIMICRSLNVAILAEGVETPAQRNFLRDAGCFAVQGFLYGRPVPAEECFERAESIAS
jgi:diguanylate cyclase (GGDEF)-like protein